MREQVGDATLAVVTRGKEWQERKRHPLWMRTAWPPAYFKCNLSEDPGFVFRRDPHRTFRAEAPVKAHHEGHLARAVPLVKGLLRPRRRRVEGEAWRAPRYPNGDVLWGGEGRGGGGERGRGGRRRFGKLRGRGLLYPVHCATFTAKVGRASCAHEQVAEDPWAPEAKVKVSIGGRFSSGGPVWRT